MLLYADCANIETLKKMDELGVLSGITTNPAILARESAPPAATIANICRRSPATPYSRRPTRWTAAGWWRWP